MRKTLIIPVCLLLFVSLSATAREWSDASGNYHFEGNVIAFDDANLVLQKPDKTLLAVDFEQLSEADQEFLRSAEAKTTADKSKGELQTWTMRNGLVVVGNVIDYVRRDVTVRMFRGKIYVNDKLYENLPDVYKKIVPLIVGEFTGDEITDEADMRNWLRRRRGEPETFTVDGVLLEFASGDLYGVPFFLFSEKALVALKPGWNYWLAAEDDAAQRQRSAFEVETQARLYQQSPEEDMQQMMRLQLQLQAYDAGLFSLWEVVLYPQRGNYGMPLSVVVPGRDSRQAGEAALANNPGYSLGPIAKVSRKY